MIFLAGCEFCLRGGRLRDYTLSASGVKAEISNTGEDGNGNGSDNDTDDDNDKSSMEAEKQQ